MLLALATVLLGSIVICMRDIVLKALDLHEIFVELGLTHPQLAVERNPKSPAPHTPFIAHGPDAFVEVARDYTDYQRAMLRKLLREIAADFVAGVRQ